MWEKILSQGEEIKYEFGIGKQYINIRTALIIIIGVLFLSLGFGIFIIAYGLFYYWYLNNAYKIAFTNKRVLKHRGWLSTDLISIDYDKITDIKVEEPFINKIIYGIGYLYISTASTPNIILDSIDNPYEVKKILDGLKGNKTN